MENLLLSKKLLVGKSIESTINIYILQILVLTFLTTKTSDINKTVEPNFILVIIFLSIKIELYLESR